MKCSNRQFRKDPSETRSVALRIYALINHPEMTYRPTKKRLRQVQRQSISMRKAVVAFSFAAVAGAFLFIINNIGTSESALANPGKDGARTITAAGTIVNEYTTLSSNVSAGATSLTVAASSLNANSRFSGSLSAGDLVLIIQMQGASITTSDNSSYGNVSNYNNCGRYEFAKVSARPNATTITLANGLRYAYTSSGKVQVIRVPRYSDLTIDNGASITCPDWDGSTGGIVAVESANNITINGSINVTGKGFRGGAIEQNSYLPGNASKRRSTDASDGGEKGESIAGLASSLSNGRYCRNAPANGGGGGNAHNCAGGGGANAGSPAAWNGNGNPDNSNANWTTAWNLESSGFANNTSTGGGRGGYSYSANDGNELTRAPGHTDWGGDNRLNGGGLGGRPLDYSSGRIFMGGGGGAGDSNNNTGTPGGDGGGIVFLLVKNNVSGGGTIYANGDAVTTQTGNDGAGGGGGGGAVVIHNHSGATSSISIEAKGGAGGNQNLSWTEAEGAGGGGGGGYVAISNLPSISINVAGGASGTTNSPSVSNFTPNGGTMGGPGETASLPGSFNPYSASSNPLPVVLTSFTLNPQGNMVQVKWTTSSEINNDFFKIERSWDAYSFEEIGRVHGAGNSSVPRAYTFSDDEPFNGTSYYRLTQVDYDGQSETFAPQSITRTTVLTALKINTIGPNPFIDELNILMEFPEPTTLRAELFTQDGKKVWETMQEVDQGRQSFTLTPEITISGVYLLRLTDSKDNTVVTRLVKK